MSTRFFLAIFLSVTVIATQAQVLTSGQYKGTIGSPRRPLTHLQLSAHVQADGSISAFLDRVDASTGFSTQLVAGSGTNRPNGSVRIQFPGGSYLRGRVSTDGNSLAGLLAMNTANGILARPFRLQWMPPPPSWPLNTSSGLVIYLVVHHTTLSVTVNSDGTLLVIPPIAPEVLVQP